ncbi:MAG TPA: sigma-70 family RNA polymerase sigma factor [Steroidobacteraceae bacterium]|jgi:RNA polymerase sigma factor (sigma-70 family)|nr:sigma-70 family RNA polymerase sigma factor [Steroidobacteraceae bacterium]
MGLAQETDENLMLRFGRGEAAAFDFLYRRHELKVFRYLQRSVKSEASANDLMQEVWFAVVRGAANYQPTAKFTTWLFTIAHNRMVDMVRANHRLQSLDTGDAADREGAESEGPSLLDRLAADRKLEPLAQVQSQDEAAALLSAVEQLPAEQRSAFLLQAEGELSVEEIADATGSNFETVKSRLRYARAKLRQLLWEYA